MNRILILVALVCIGSSMTVPATAQITSDQALEIARQVAHQIHPDLDSPETKVHRNETDQCVAMDVSDPYQLNGELFYRTFTAYEYTKNPVGQYTGIGERTHAASAPAPLPSNLPADLKAKVLEWVAYWRAQGHLSSDVRAGARRTKVYLFRFHRGGLMGPNAFVGVDSLGQTFELNLDSSLVPWGHDQPVNPRIAAFQALYLRAGF